MIKLIRNPDQLNLFGEAPTHPPVAGFVHDECWRKIGAEELQNLRLGDLASGRMRFMTEFWHKGKRIFIVTSTEDESRCREKHPGSIVINANQIIALMRQPLPDAAGIFPDIVNALSVFEGARVI